MGDGQWLAHNAGVCPVTWADSKQLNMAIRNATSSGELRAAQQVIFDPLYRDMESHVVGVMYYSDRIAQVMGKSEADRILIARGALLHDIGKNDPVIAWWFNLDLPSQIAVKEQHVWSGVARLNSFGVDETVVNFARYHHPGYANMPSPDTVDELIQILTAGDQLSAGLLDRIYVKARPRDVVLGWLERDMRDKFLTPEIYEAAWKVGWP